MPEHMPMPPAEKKPESVDDGITVIQVEDLEEAPDTEVPKTRPMTLLRTEEPLADPLASHKAEEEDLRLAGVAEDAMKEPIESPPVTLRSPEFKPVDDPVVSGVREKSAELPSMESEEISAGSGGTPEGASPVMTTNEEGNFQMSARGTETAHSENPMKRLWNKLLGKKDAS